MKKRTPVIMNMSGIYIEETFWKGQETVWVEAEDITGTNCYCDEDARTELSRRIDKFSPEGVHFIDSGNYHYLTRLWIGKIQQPFRLLVFDNHTDMQPPAFGGLLSCGGWIAAALEELTNLQQVILIGPDENAYSQVDERLRKKVVFLSRETLLTMKEEEICGFLKNVMMDSELPVYLSVDKDVLSSKEVSTAWSQGDMKLTTLLACVETMLECGKSNEGRLLGVDICGEADVKGIHDNDGNDRANLQLLKLLCI